MFTTLSGLKIAVPAKAGEPEYIWRHLRQAEQNVDVYEHAQKLGATPLQNLEALLDDFSFFAYPFGPIESFPQSGSDYQGWYDVSTWKQVGASWVMKVKTNDGYYHFTYNERCKTLRMERSDNSEFKGKTAIKWFNL